MPDAPRTLRLPSCSVSCLRGPTGAVSDTLDLDIGSRITVRPHDLASLRFSLQPLPPHRIHGHSAVGQPGADLYPCDALTLNSPDGTQIDVLTFVEARADGRLETHLVPFGALPPGDYTVTALSPYIAAVRLAQHMSVGFLPQTRVMIGSGVLKPVDDLQVGETVLTRDSGAQPVLWIGRSTQPGLADAAPVMLDPEVFHTAADLTLLPQHRLFLYQRDDVLNLGRPEILLSAHHFVPAGVAQPRPAARVTAVHLLLPQHDVIYAEGIAVESSGLPAQARALIPPSLFTQSEDLLEAHRKSSLDGFEVALDREDMAAALTRVLAASQG